MLNKLTMNRLIAGCMVRAQAHWKVLALSAVALAIAGLAVSRSGLLTGPAAAARAEAIHRASIREGDRVYASVELADIDSLGSPEAARAHIRGVAAGSTPASPDADEIACLAGEFVYYRFGQPSVDAYKRWRRARGEALVDPARLRGWQVPEDYARCLGRAYPGDGAAEAVFDEFWAVGRNAPDGGVRVRALASEPAGVCIAWGELGPGGEGAWPRLTGDLDEGAWEGTRTLGFRVWWQHPSFSLSDAIKSAHRTRVAAVGIIVELRDGNRFPLRLAMYQHPEERRWRIHGVGITNENPLLFTVPFES